jgi:GH35 family endo-1,4-beta-xylanase
VCTKTTGDSNTGHKGEKKIKECLWGFQFGNKLIAKKILIKTYTGCLQVRKRDVILSFGGASAGASAWNLSGASVRVVQMGNAFPQGSCINGQVIQDPAFVDFFTNHLDWAVFENELQWYWTESRRGQLNYADRLLDFCDRAGKPVRGHCIFWSVEAEVQQWIRDIGGDRGQLKSMVQGRLRGLLSRYAGRFPHYDVNNEMLHGHFYRDRLGDDVAALMFREAARLDPGAALFVNDYNVERGNDPDATPEKYVEQVRDLQRCGARVGGFGLQGHLMHPVGEVICDALDKLATTGLPVWITELDVCEPDEELRADDLEVVLREVYAHPAVQGVVLWGFMQGHLWRQDAYLVDSNGAVNDARQRFIDLRREWTSEARGRVDASSNSGASTARTSCRSLRRRGTCSRPSLLTKGTHLSCLTSWTCDLSVIVTVLLINTRAIN